MGRGAFLLLVLALVGLAQRGAAAAEPRVALVVGVGQYQAAPALANPPNDARMIAAAFRKLGFAVDEVIDPDNRALRDAVRRFGIRAQSADAAIVFYAGHGMQVNHANYLVPADARLERERDLVYEAMNLELVLHETAQARKVGIVILDACRNNPFTDLIARSMGLAARGPAAKGLARVDLVPSNTAVAMATRDNDVAEDGSGEHSPYAQAILAHLEVPGLELGLFFRAVRDAVLKATGNRQEPYFFSSLGAEPFYFNPPRPVAKQASPAAAGKAADPVNDPQLRAAVARLLDEELARREAERKQAQDAARKRKEAEREAAEAAEAERQAQAAAAAEAEKRAEAEARREEQERQEAAARRQRAAEGARRAEAARIAEAERQAAETARREEERKAAEAARREEARKAAEASRREEERRAAEAARKAAEAARAQAGSATTPGAAAPAPPREQLAVARPPLAPPAGPGGFRCPRAGTLIETSVGGYFLYRADSKGAHCRVEDKSGARFERIFGFAGTPRIRAHEAEVARLWPLEPGKTVSFVDTQDRDSWSITFEVVGSERITVKAGTFDTIVIAERLSGLENNRHVSVERFWFVPELGAIIKAEINLQRGTTASRDWEAIRIVLPDRD